MRLFFISLFFSMTFLALVFNAIAGGYSSINLDKAMADNIKAVQAEKDRKAKFSKVEALRKWLSTQLQAPPAERDPSALENYYNLVGLETFIEYLPQNEAEVGRCAEKKRSFEKAYGNSGTSASPEKKSGVILHIEKLFDELCKTGD